MSFLRNHGTASALGAVFGSASGYFSTRHIIITPEMWLSAKVPELVEKIAVLLGYSDIAEMCPWWPRDAPVWWMVPLMAVLIWLFSIPCRAEAPEAAAQTLEAEHQSMLQLRMKRAEMTVHHAELRTPASKTFGKLDLEAAEQVAQKKIVSQTAADVDVADAAHVEYETFLRESLREWRLLRFQVVVAYVLGFAATYLLDLGGFIAIPFLALILPISIFVVLVSASVLSEWTVFLLGKLCGGDEDDVDGASAWGLALRSTQDDGPGCCDSCAYCLRACCQSLFPATASERFGGAPLRKPGEYVPSPNKRVGMY